MSAVKKECTRTLYNAIVVLSIRNILDGSNFFFFEFMLLIGKIRKDQKEQKSFKTETN